jgi:hypothetical protein
MPPLGRPKLDAGTRPSPVGPRPVDSRADLRTTNGRKYTGRAAPTVRGLRRDGRGGRGRDKRCLLSQLAEVEAAEDGRGRIVLGIKDAAQVLVIVRT